MCSTHLEGGFVIFTVSSNDLKIYLREIYSMYSLSCEFWILMFIYLAYLNVIVATISFIFFFLKHSHLIWKSLAKFYKSDLFFLI